MNLRVAVSGEAEGHEAPRRSESEPEQGDIESEEADAKPSDLHTARMKSR